MSQVPDSKELTFDVEFPIQLEITFIGDDLHWEGVELSPPLTVVVNDTAILDFQYE